MLARGQAFGLHGTPMSRRTSEPPFSPTLWTGWISKRLSGRSCAGSLTKSTASSSRSLRSIGCSRAPPEKRPAKYPDATKRVPEEPADRRHGEGVPNSEHRRVSAGCWFEPDMATAEVS